MKKFLLIVLFYASGYTVNAQIQDAWIYFTDKPDATYFLANPLEMLSQRALDRRANQNIPLDEKDIPIHPDYITQVKNSQGITVMAQSKWLNCLHIQGLQTDIEPLVNLNFVDRIEFADTTLSDKKLTNNRLGKKLDKLEVLTDYNYGNAANQIQMLKGEYLHQNNFTGSGMQIAVMDAGFTNVNTISAFNRLFTNNQVLGTYNFVKRSTDVYGYHYHGTMVLSTMAGYINNQYVGTAPDASYYLFITEDASQEHPYEESLWVEAAEKADSLGIDVINTSLGYTTFDNPSYNHTYSDMDGKTAFMSRGAEIAFSRGILVINSAGNDGNKTWHYIGVPADAPSVLSIGAVSSSELIADFSSWGPTSDGRIKPDVCAQGKGTYVINTLGQIVSTDGTSFSGPILAGTATCFWQAFPEKTNIEIAQAIRNSADRYSNPDNHYGYGIPDFESAFQTLQNGEESVIEADIVYPNPVKQNSLLQIEYSLLNNDYKVFINDLQGKTIKEYQVESHENQIRIPEVTPGIYILIIQTSTQKTIHKLIIR